jgi:GrpB-like predicted nucleotidyltransferase (UPF0157 family)
MIGLRKGTVKLVSHRPIWKQMFEEEATRLRQAMGHTCLAIEHIGSTAIEGLDAKPIIDILVAVDDLGTVNDLKPVLAELGYSHKEDDSVVGRVFFRKGPPSRRTHHLSLTELGTAYWKCHLLFRDYLRKHPTEAEQYQQLKRRLAKQYAKDRGAYTSKKQEFIKKVIRLAEIEEQEQAA